MNKSVIALEAILKAVDENAYINVYLKNPKLHGNTDVLQAIIDSCQTYDSVFLEHEEALTNMKEDQYNEGYEDGLEKGKKDGYDSGYEDGVEDGYQSGVDQTTEV